MLHVTGEVLDTWMALRVSQEFVDSLDGIPEKAKQALKQLTPATYIGNAVEQALALKNFK